jgi:uncharacterized protein
MVGNFRQPVVYSYILQHGDERDTIMTATLRTIDSHVHVDLIERDHPRRIEWLKEHGCGVVSWSYFDDVSSVGDLNRRFDANARCLRAHAAAGMYCRYLVGIHPRSIPVDLKPESIEGILTPFFDDPLCRGIGEIGLETGTAHEREMLLAQLDIGRRLRLHGQVVGVHTPRKDKPAITAETLDLLAGYADLAPVLVIDHCTAATIGSVLNAGFWAGVTLSPPKTGWWEMQAIAATEARRIDRIMLNTDSGSAVYDDVVRCRDAADLPEAIREKLFLGNAMRFFGLAAPDE